MSYHRRVFSCTLNVSSLFSLKPAFLYNGCNWDSLVGGGWEAEGAVVRFAACVLSLCILITSPHCWPHLYTKQRVWNYAEISLQLHSLRWVFFHVEQFKVYAFPAFFPILCYTGFVANIKLNWNKFYKFQKLVGCLRNLQLWSKWKSIVLNVRVKKRVFSLCTQNLATQLMRCDWCLQEDGVVHWIQNWVLHTENEFYFWLTTYCLSWWE